MGRTHAAVSDIELGKTNLTVQDLNTIASYLGVSISYFLDEPKHSKATVHFRDAKDTSPDELKELERAADEFIQRARRIAKSGQDTTNKE